MKQFMIPAVALAAVIAQPAFAQTPAPDQLTQRSTERRAVEAVIWGMPAVNYDLMLQEMLSKTDGKVNQVDLLGPTARLAQPDAHAQSGRDLLHGVLQHQGSVRSCSMCRRGDSDGSFNANIVNVWQMPLEDAGSARRRQGQRGQVSGPAAGLRRQGARRLHRAAVGHVWRLHAVPFESQKPQRAPTSRNRSRTASGSRSIRSRRRPIRRRPSSPTPRTSLFDSTIRYDASFFEHLDRIVQSEPWLQRDRAMIDQLKSFGIEKGKPFKPDDADQGAADGGDTRSAGLA